MPESPVIERATFTNITENGDPFEVHFNPQTLQYTITNQLANTGSGNSTKQYTGESTGKLTFDLVFDTTDTGEDVRLHTVRVAQLMEPGSNDDRTPPIVEFSWGLYTFSGMVESYRETLDFFSANGVPLRAAINLTMSSQDDVFEGGSRNANANTGGSLADRSGENDLQVPSPGQNDGRGVTQIATQGGNPSAARTIATQNGVENMRFPGGSLQLGGPVKPASSSSLTGTQYNSSQSGIFAGLHAAGEVQMGASLKLNNFLRPPSTASFGTDKSAVFALGGQIRLKGSASLKAEVGTSGALKSRIEFDGGE